MASLLLLAPILGFLGHVTAAAVAGCASLSGWAFSNDTASVYLATDVPQGTNFSTSDGPQTNDLPGFCRIALSIKTSPETSAKAEVWLPEPDEWNARLLTVGNGGFAGSIN
ncbi:feruloyl esterase B [Apiospora phragmitis]|uniref:feruloyl esterase n=1 Tax=Apiospora phragmitis TaxID=2905665 RepID=A0ABR1TVE7_9PEZI